MWGLVCNGIADVDGVFLVVLWVFSRRRVEIEVVLVSGGLLIVEFERLVDWFLRLGVVVVLVVSDDGCSDGMRIVLER